MTSRRLARAGALLLTAISIGVAISCYPAYLAGDFRYVLVGALLIVATMLPAIPMRVTLLQFAVGGALLVALNLAATPFFHDSARTLTPNYFARVQVVGDVMPGFSGIQTISTDAKGYRTNTPVDYANKPAGTLRIFAIGGSTTEELALGDDKTWVTLMARILEERTGRRVEAINTGVSGLRADHHVATLRKIERYAPDLVVVMMGFNDWNRHIKTGGNAYFETLYDLLEHLDVRKSLLAEAYRGAHVRLARMRQESVSAEPRPDDGSYLSNQNDSLNRPVKREFLPHAVSANYSRNAREVMDICRSHKLACLLVDQATAYDPEIEPALRKRLWMTPPNESYTLTLENMAYISGTYNSWLRQAAASAGLPFCGISQQARPTTAFFYDDCHFNEPGARAVARLISDCVLAQKLVSR